MEALTCIISIVFSQNVNNQWVFIQYIRGCINFLYNIIILEIQQELLLVNTLYVRALLIIPYKVTLQIVYAVLKSIHIRFLTLVLFIPTFLGIHCKVMYFLV